MKAQLNHIPARLSYPRQKERRILRVFQYLVVALVLVRLAGLPISLNAQPSQIDENHAGYIPAISGGMGYIHKIDGGIPTLEPQLAPVLLIPVGSHILFESRTDFTGFYQKEMLTSGSYTGKIFTDVAFAQIDWLANSHVNAVAGRYLLPFGLYSERLQPIWIKNLQDSPITAAIGTRTSGSGDGIMLRGVATQQPSYSIQYTAYFSVLSNVTQLQSARAAGGDASIFFNQSRVEIGASYQRFLQDHQINSVATYLSWQPALVPLDLKCEGDYSYNGRGYWLEPAYRLQNMPIPRPLQRFQIVGRWQAFFPQNGGGNSLPRVKTRQLDAGLNYYIRDDLRIVSSFGRTYTSQLDINSWNVGITYRFLFPMWPGRSK